MKLIKTFVNRSLFTCTLFFTVLSANAQEGSENPLDTLTTAVNRLHSDLSVLKRIKFTGYIQMQWQKADTAGAASVAGGNFPLAVDNRFDIRRGRLKLTYDNTLSTFVFQLDISQRGVELRDAFFKVTEPYKNVLSLTAGMFNRPISYDLEYSSVVRESPERSRVVQRLLPSERDMGAKLTFQPVKESPWHMLKAEVGVLQGSGLASTSDFDSFKDFVANIGINKTSRNEKFTYGLRLAYYNGGIKQGDKFVFSKFDHNNAGDLIWSVDSATSNINGRAKREYKAADLQLTYDFPFGITSLRAEYLTGQQVGSATSSSSPNSGVAPTGDTYIRPFTGGYIFLVQDIFTTRHQIVAKFDWYDPNSKASGNDIGKLNSYLNGTDVKYTTIGLGWNYHMSANLKLMIYYDMVHNEKTPNLAAFSRDLKDNILTIRMQYRFF